MGLIATNPTNIQELLTDWVDEVKNKPPAQPVNFSDDPIALSWASYHVWKKFPARRWVDLKDVEAHDWDREIAAATRKYYRDRFTVQALKGQTSVWHGVRRTTHHERSDRYADDLALFLRGGCATG